MGMGQARDGLSPVAAGADGRQLAVKKETTLSVWAMSSGGLGR
jgi:hypothetical protein